MFRGDGIECRGLAAFDTVGIAVNALKKIDYHLDMAEVADRYSISVRTLERWLRDPAIGFPKPMMINKRRFFRASDLHQFDAEKTGRDVDEKSKALGFEIASDVIQTYEDFVKAMRARREALDMPCSEVDARSGMQENYTNKLENPGKKYGRGVGPDTLPLWLGGLRVGIILVDLPRRPRKGNPNG